MLGIVSTQEVPLFFFASNRLFLILHIALFPHLSSFRARFCVSFFFEPRWRR
jgi:hypothetical protein